MPPKKKKQTLFSFNPKEVLNTHRQLFLYGEVNYQTSASIRQQILACDIASHQPITLWISSHGGSCDAGLAIIEVMKAVASPIRTIINGSVMSMASIISICGDDRLAFSTSTWGQHPTSASQGDYLSYIKDRTAYLIKFDKVLTDIMKENTKLTPSDYKKIETGELWLMGNELLEKGIVTKLI
jgi:ATP-dependent Clp protease protease subunit